jgi:hypothetical protein
MCSPLQMVDDLPENYERFRDAFQWKKWQRYENPH